MDISASLSSGPIVASRQVGLDALRATLTLLVVFHHCALTYGAIGGWYYREVQTDGRPATLLLVLFCTVNQAWFMGLFFLLAGYFTPQSVDRLGVVGYLRERLLRLGVPLLAFMLAIGPLTIALAQTARGHPFLPTLQWLWEHRAFENGPLWFTQTLLLFGLLYCAWRGIARRPLAVRPFPSNRVLALAALTTGAMAFGLRFVWPVGFTWCGMQFGYFASYVVLFAAGCIGARSRWLSEIPDRTRRLWLTVAWLTLPVLPAVSLLASSFPVLRGNSSGGWNVQAAIYAWWEPLVAWGVVLALVSGFTRRVRQLGPLWASLTRRAYGIYIIHPPVLVAVALAWRAVAAPPLVKFIVTGTVSCLMCFWIAGLLLRMPGVRRTV